MSLREKLSIEALTEGRWARVERGIFRALDQGTSAAGHSPLRREGVRVRWRSSTSLVLAGAAAAAIGALTWRTIAQREQRDLQAGPTRVETAATGSRVEVGESTVDVGPRSSVRVAGDDAHGVMVVLDGGRVEVDVSPRRDRPPFIVQAGPVEVRVVGTHFVVTRSGAAVTVDVQRGKVEVTSGDQHAFVGAGTRWPPSSEGASTAIAPATSAPAANDLSPVSHPQAVPSARASVPLQREQGARKAEARSLTQREQYESASKLEAREPESALGIYRELSAEGGKWAMNALFAEGRLEADRGHGNEAGELLRDYLSRYPRGPNAEDARRLLGHLP